MYTRIAVLALLCAYVCGCISDLLRSDEQVDASVVATWWDGPRIRPGISLLVQVGSVGQQPTVMQVLVDQGGSITLPLLLTEPVACDGLTLEALKLKLVKSYEQYYKQPQVVVTFAPWEGKGVSPWGTVTVLGEVMRPGPVNMPATMDMTVTKVLQEAGGLKQFADKTEIKVSRCDKDGKQSKYTVDIEEIGERGRPDKDMILRPGDVVWVPQTWY